MLPRAPSPRRSSARAAFVRTWLSGSRRAPLEGQGRRPAPRDRPATGPRPLPPARSAGGRREGGPGPGRPAPPGLRCCPSAIAERQRTVANGSRRAAVRAGTAAAAADPKAPRVSGTRHRNVGSSKASRRAGIATEAAEGPMAPRRRHHLASHLGAPVPEGSHEGRNRGCRSLAEGTQHARRLRPPGASGSSSTPGEGGRQAAGSGSTFWRAVAARRRTSASSSRKAQDQGHSGRPPVAAHLAERPGRAGAHGGSGSPRARASGGRSEEGRGPIRPMAHTAARRTSALSSPRAAHQGGKRRASLAPPSAQLVAPPGSASAGSPFAKASTRSATLGPEAPGGPTQRPGGTEPGHGLRRREERLGTSSVRQEARLRISSATRSLPKG